MFKIKYYNRYFKKQFLLAFYSSFKQIFIWIMMICKKYSLLITIAHFNLLVHIKAKSRLESFHCITIIVSFHDQPSMNGALYRVCILQSDTQTVFPKYVSKKWYVIRISMDVISILPRSDDVTSLVLFSHVWNLELVKDRDLLDGKLKRKYRSRIWIQVENKAWRRYHQRICIMIVIWYNEMMHIWTISFTVTWICYTFALTDMTYCVIVTLPSHRTDLTELSHIHILIDVINIFCT